MEVFDLNYSNYINGSGWGVGVYLGLSYFVMINTLEGNFFSKTAKWFLRRIQRKRIAKNTTRVYQSLKIFISWSLN